MLLLRFGAGGIAQVAIDWVVGRFYNAALGDGGNTDWQPVCVVGLNVQSGHSKAAAWVLIQIWVVGELCPR